MWAEPATRTIRSETEVPVEGVNVTGIGMDVPSLDVSAKIGVEVARRVSPKTIVLYYVFSAHSASP